MPCGVIMKTSRVYRVLILGLTFAGAALATPPPVSPGDGGGLPSAPEPGLMLMAVSGLVVGGAYLMWRRRQIQKA